jgi:hypothetical protein
MEGRMAGQQKVNLRFDSARGGREYSVRKWEQFPRKSPINWEETAMKLRNPIGCVPPVVVLVCSLLLVAPAQGEFFQQGPKPAKPEPNRLK